MLLLALGSVPALAAGESMELKAARHAFEAGHAALAIKQVRPLVANNPEGQFLMGRILEEGGEGVRRNPRQAISWYARAADSGYPEAFYALGRLFERGEEGLPRNYRDARHWYEKGAKVNHVPSQVHLGLMLNEGRGGPRDVTEGLAWLALAEEAGASAARQILPHHLGSLGVQEREQLSRRTAELRATLPRVEPDSTNLPH